ncbi:MAG: ABC transporter permease, partial [Acidobacteria bacterium]|nr:ABC transporter permease [Acidobacteriota bacterium]
MHDLRAAGRALAASRGFTLLAVLALALGIGANGAIFTVVNAVLLKPLPYRDPGRLVMVWSENPQTPGQPNVLSPADFADLRAMSRSFSAMEFALSFLVRVGVTGREDEGLLTVSRVGASLLDLLGVQPQLGRVFGRDERGVAVLSDAAWRSRFGGDPGVIGRRLTVSGNETLEIVGVAPPAFAFPYRSMLGASAAAAQQPVDLWAPMPVEGSFFFQPNGQPVRAVHFLVALARLAPGVTVDAARAEVATHAAVIAARHPDTSRGWGATVVSLHDQTVGSARPALLVLLGGVGVLLLMAMVNVANLMLARSLARQRELAVRAALGASGAQLVRQVLAERLLLAAGGAVVSLLAVRWAVRGLVALAPPSLPRLADIAPDTTVVVAACALALIVGALVGLVPMWAAATPDVRTVLQEASRGAAGTSRAGRRVRAVLVVSQIALATVLAVQAGLLTRSFAALLAVDPGFQPDHLLTLQMTAPDRLQSADDRRAFYQDWFARLQGLPGVVAAGGTTRIPLGSTTVSTTVFVDGRPVDKAQLPEVEFRRAMHDYFTAMRIPVRRGRGFTAADGPAAPPVAVVNDAFVARVFPGQDPLGQRIALGPDGAGPKLTIVGVIGDVRHGSLEETPAAELYINYLQNPPVAPFIAVRTTGDPAALAASVRQLARTMDPPFTIFDVRTMDDLRSASVGERRFTLVLVGAFGLVAVLLAAVGVYGVVALVVGERTGEFGLRVALGAVPATVARLVVREALHVTLIGVGAGLVLAAGAARLLQSQLFGVTALDPMTFAAVPLALVASALVAAVAPALRAARLDPM